MRVYKTDYPPGVYRVNGRWYAVPEGFKGVTRGQVQEGDISVDGRRLIPGSRVVDVVMVLRPTAW